MSVRFGACVQGVLISVRAGKTTDENLTSENWELILNLCDKVSDEGQEGCVFFFLRSYRKF